MSSFEMEISWPDTVYYLATLDAALAPMISQINTAAGQTDEYLMDRAEYFFGAGFVAIQKFMLETCLIREIDVKRAVNLEIPDEEQAPFEAAVWAAANYWKHDAEWWSAFSTARTSKSETPEIRQDTARNASVLSAFGRFGTDHLCANVLAAYSPSKELRLCSLEPLILEWRSTL